MRVLLALAMVLGLGACRAYPTTPVNRRPTISGVVAFPGLIGQGDSTLVTVFATDPDGDPLVYDWFTDSRLVIKGSSGEPDLYNTPSASHVFYRSTFAAVDETTAVWCSVRDLKGGGDSRRVLIVLRD